MYTESLFVEFLREYGLPTFAAVVLAFVAYQNASSTRKMAETTSDAVKGMHENSMALRQVAGEIKDAIKEQGVEANRRDLALMGRLDVVSAKIDAVPPTVHKHLLETGQHIRDDLQPVAKMLVEIAQMQQTKKGMLEALVQGFEGIRDILMQLRNQGSTYNTTLTKLETYFSLLAQSRPIPPPTSLFTPSEDTLSITSTEEHSSNAT